MVGQLAKKRPKRRGSATIDYFLVVGVVMQLTQTYLFERNEPVDRVADACVAFCVFGVQGS